LGSKPPRIQPPLHPLPPTASATASLRQLLDSLSREQRRNQELLASLAFALRSFTNLNRFLELVPLVAARLMEAEGALLLPFHAHRRSFSTLGALLFHSRRPPLDAVSLLPPKRSSPPNVPYERSSLPNGSVAGVLGPRGCSTHCECCASAQPKKGRSGGYSAPEAERFSSSARCILGGSLALERRRDGRSEAVEEFGGGSCRRLDHGRLIH
jgi:hypothetical protein